MANVDPVFVNDLDGVLREQGEELVYTFEDGTTRTINAIVRRGHPGREIDEVGYGKSSDLTVLILHSTLAPGIKASEIIKGRDTITLSPLHGDTKVAHTVQEIMATDAGGILLRIS